MKTLMNKLTDLRSEADLTIKNLIIRHHVKSEFQPDTYVLQLEDISFLTHQPEIHGHNIVEVGDNRLIDDLGNDYMFCTLPVETVLEIADHLTKKLDDVQPKYHLTEDTVNIIDSHYVEIKEKIFDEEMFDYKIEDREELISNIYGWVAEAKESDKFLMKQDIELLSKIDDDYVFSSISTNEYIYEGCKNFNSTCEALIKLNESLS